MATPYIERILSIKRIRTSSIKNGLLGALEIPPGDAPLWFRTTFVDVKIIFISAKKDFWQPVGKIS
jgi:hypothetical protein